MGDKEVGEKKRGRKRKREEEKEGKEGKREESMEGRREKDKQKKIKISQTQNLKGAGHVALW